MFSDDLECVPGSSICDVHRHIGQGRWLRLGSGLSLCGGLIRRRNLPLEFLESFEEGVSVYCLRLPADRDLRGGRGQGCGLLTELAHYCLLCYFRANRLRHVLLPQMTPAGTTRPQVPCVTDASGTWFGSAVAGGDGYSDS